MIKVALYARVSTEEQALHGYSIEAQKEALTKYAKEHNMEIIDIFVDEGISARKKYNKRKEFIRLLEGVKTKHFDLILFTKLDRWFRNIADYYKIQEILESNNVNWKTIYENYDTSTASGRLHINIMLSVAQDEADRTSERIKVVFNNKVQNKQVITGKMPFGYIVVDKKVEIDEEKAGIIRDIFDYYLEHQSVNATMKYMNAKYNFKKCYDFYADILKTKMFTGTFHDVEDYCPAIITKEQFNATQKIEKQSFVRQNQTFRVYIFSGMIKCKECGHAMHGRQNVTTQNKFMAYVCRNATAYHRCNNKLTIREDKIEDFLVNNINRLHDEYVTDSKIRKNAKKKLPIADKAVIKKKLKKLKELYVEDLISMEEYRIDYNKYNAELLKIDEEEEETPITNIESISEIFKSNFKPTYEALDRENRRIFWRSMIKELQIDVNHNIDIIF